MYKPNLDHLIIVYLKKIKENPVALPNLNKFIGKDNK